MIAPQPFFEARGTPISVYQRLKALAHMGKEIDLVTYHLGQDVTIPGVTLHRIPNIPFIDEVKVGPSLTKLLLDCFVFVKAFVLLLRQRYDVIHSHEEASFFSVFLAAVFRTAHLYDMHSSLPKQLDNFNYGNIRPVIAVFRWLEMLVLNTCDAVITIDEGLDEYVKSINPSVPTVRIHNLPIRFGAASEVESASLVEVKEQILSDGRLAVVYTGTFERYQGLDYLIEAVPLMPKDVARRLLFVLVGGTTAQVGKLEARVEALDLEHMFAFPGSVPLDDSYRFLDLAEILVSPRLEGTSVPLKIYSYMHAERAILATRIPAHTRVLNDKLAMLVEPTPEGFALGLERLLCEPGLRPKLATRVKAHAIDNFNPEEYMEGLERVYSELSRTRTHVGQTSHLVEH